jgi:hypothetical protein
VAHPSFFFLRFTDESICHLNEAIMARTTRSSFSLPVLNKKYICVERENGEINNSRRY